MNGVSFLSLSVKGMIASLLISSARIMDRDRKRAPTFSLRLVFKGAAFGGAGAAPLNRRTRLPA